MEYPKKADKLYIERLEDELCVYDWERKTVHALNPTAAAVLNMCDGETGVTQMATRLSAELDVPQAENVVRLSLTELDKAGLLAAGNANNHPISRRDVLKAMGVAAVMLPVVTSIMAPTPAQAQSDPCANDFGANDVVDFQNGCTQAGGGILFNTFSDFSECCAEATGDFGSDLIGLFFDANSSADNCNACVTGNNNVVGQDWK